MNEVKWYTSTSLDGEEMHFAHRRGFRIEIMKLGYGYSGSFTDGSSHFNCGESQNLETFKKRIVATVDNVSVSFHGKWHPYPAEKPSEEVKEYIVSAVFPNGEKFTICSEWQGSEEKGWGGLSTCMVTAWTELPTPYMGGDE